MSRLFHSRQVLPVAALLLIVTGLAGRGLLDEAGFWLHDRARDFTGLVPEAGVAVVAIDEASLARLGDYPLSYTLNRRVVKNLQAAGARHIVWLDSTLTAATPAAGGDVQGVAMIRSGESADPAYRLPDFVRTQALPQPSADSGLAAWRGRSVLPLSAWRSASTTRYGFFLADPGDGLPLRRVPLLLDVGGDLLPSVALQAYLASQGHAAGAARLVSGPALQLADRTIPLDRQGRVLADLRSMRDKQPMIDVIPYHDVLHGAVPTERLQGRTVLVGTTASGLVPMTTLADGERQPPVIVAAMVLVNLLQQTLAQVPAWAAWAGYAAIALAFLLSLGLPLLAPLPRAAATVTALAGFTGLPLTLLLWGGLWLDLLPAILLLAGGAVLAPLCGTRATDNAVPGHAMEIHRRVGLASQKRGELDAAFESFRKCPMDNSIMVLLYYLAIDYENAERFDRAIAVYEYMETYDADYKDIRQRTERAQVQQRLAWQDRAGVVVEDGPPPVAAPVDGLRVGDMLGRYQIEREIGKGAMGLVYRGSDPKINRTMAIKTLNLRQEFEPGDQAAVLDRFFREAEAAGRLHHPNIVTIYDAGEVHDLAYIAMEYLSGSDLRVYTKEGTLLPPLTVVKIGMKLADALAYAHANDIIHRDIKAANVMYDPATGQLKITDFGIARLTDSRRTKTGMVLGTPSSMSPEQLRGKALDGRTDLYSLGVLLFQLLTGQLPYRAESLSQLMYKITREEPPDLFELRPELREQGECIHAIIDKLLQKDPNDRYQDGKKLARDLLACAKRMAGRKP